jgi:hypothetical protein
MKKSLIYTLLLFLTLSLSGQRTGIMASSGTASSTLLTGLVSAWECNEASGTIIDVKGNNNSASQTVTYGNAGKNGNCLTFTSTNIVTLANITGWTISSASSCSISAWVNFTGAQAGTRSIIIGNGMSGAPELYFANEDAPQYDLRWYVGGVAISGATEPTVSYGTWYQIIMVKSGTSITLYWNGSVLGTGTEGTYSALNPTAIYLGNDASGNSFTGKLDMVRFWSKALSSGEVTELYTKENGSTTYPW